MFELKFSYNRKVDFYLTIRLRAWDFYEVIVDEGEARINYHLIEIESESMIKHEIFNKKIDFLTISKKEITRKWLFRYSLSNDE